MIGISGSGKSTIAKQIAKDNGAVIVESDAYREEEYGDASVQGNHTDLFNRIHEDILSLLREGKNIVFDATNTSRKHRVALLNKTNKLDVDKIAISCMTDVETCIAQNKMRERQVPEHVIIRMWKTFNVPVYAEGWDYIQVFYNYNPEKYSVEDYLFRIKDFDQDNPHHSKTLGGHVADVGESLGGYGFVYRLIGLLHDNGKEYTKARKDIRGNDTEMSHYYQHAEVGAYESMFYLKQYVDLDVISFNDSLFIAGVILYHMRPYQLKSAKSINKLVNTIGEEMFKAVMLLNDADRKAH